MLTEPNRYTKIPSLAGILHQEDLMFGPIGWVEILVIFGLIMLLFGARKLPEIGRGLGKAISNFKRSVKEEPPLLEDDDAEEESGDENSAKKKNKQ